MTTATPDPAASPLDKRRTKWLATVDVAKAAEQALAVVDGELESTVAKRDTSKAELAAARERAAELEKEIKALAKQRERLRADRAKAKRDVGKTRGRVKVAEKKYDRAIIKDMLRQTKSAALTANEAVTAPPRSRPRAAAKATGTATRRTRSPQKATG